MVDISKSPRRLRIQDINVLTENIDGKDQKLEFKQQEGTHTFIAKSKLDPSVAYLYSLDLNEFDVINVDAVEAGLSTQKEVDAFNKKKQDDADTAAGIKNKPGVAQNNEVITGTNNVGVAGGSKVESLKKGQ